MFVLAGLQIAAVNCWGDEDDAPARKKDLGMCLVTPNDLKWWLPITGLLQLTKVKRPVTCADIAWNWFA